MMSPASAFSNCDARDLDVLVDAEDVRELQPQEADVQAASKLENVLGGRAMDVGRYRS